MTNAREFTLRLQVLLGRERVAQADFLLALSEFDRLRLWLELGYGSLFDYLHRELGLSKASTFLRARAASLIQRFPEVLEALRDGRLCLSSMGELSRVLTEENAAEVLPRFFLLSKREAKAVAAAIRPDEAPARRDVVTALRAPVDAPGLQLAAPPAPPRPAEPSFSLGVVRPGEPDPAPRHAAAPAPPPPPSTIEPLTADLIRVHLTANKRLAEKYQKAKDLISHALPGASLADVLEAGLDALIERHERRKGLVERPLAKPRPSADPGYVPAHVRREVWKRDQGRCQWPVASGICGSTHRAEVDHVTPRALGGHATVEGCRVLCQAHNLQAAREIFGDAWMDRFTRNPRAGPADERAKGGGRRR